MSDEYRGADYSNGGGSLPLPTMTCRWRDVLRRTHIGLYLLIYGRFRAC